MSGLNWPKTNPDRIAWVNPEDVRDGVAHILVRDLLDKDNETVEKLFITTLVERKCGVKVISTPSGGVVFAKIDESIPFGELHLFKTAKIFVNGVELNDGIIIGVVK